MTTTNRSRRSKRSWADRYADVSRKHRLRKCHRRSPLGLALLPLIVVLGGCGDSSGQTPARAGDGRRGPGPETGRSVPVAAEIATPREMQVMLRGSANLRARQQVDVLPKQTGVVNEIMVEEGARVRVGQPLARLDSEEWRLQARQAEARASAARDAAARAVQLQERGMVSDQEVERLQSEAQVAEADYALAELRVRNAMITAPIAGVVTHRLVERGQLVNSSAAAFRVADISRLEALVGVPEREANRIQVGQTARVRMEGRSPFQGEVARIRPVVDPESGTVQVVVEVNPDQGGGLRPGQFVNVDIVTETLDERLTLPRTAVLVDGAVPRVFTISDGRAVEREVELGVNQAERVEIRRGVAAGDTVVVVGQDNLQQGVTVNLLELDGQPVRATPSAVGAGAEAIDRNAPSTE